MSSGPAWNTEGVSGQAPKLYTETVSWKNKIKQTEKEIMNNFIDHFVLNTEPDI